MRVEKPTMEKMKINQKSFTYVIILSVNNENTLSTHAPISSTSAKPEVRGTADVGWRSLFPFRSILLVLTHDFIITCVYGPTGSDGHEWVIPTRTLVAHHFNAV